MASSRARRVVVTGFGALCPLGNGALYSWKRLLAGESGITKVAPNYVGSRLPSKVCAPVPVGPGPNQFDQARLAGQKTLRDKSLTTVYALQVAEEAVGIARWKPTSEAERERSGVSFIGGGLGDLEYICDTVLNVKRGGFTKISPFFMIKSIYNIPAASVAMNYKLKGPNRTVTTACASGVHVVGDAFRLIRSGDVDVMLAGGAEAYALSPGLAAGFSKIRALSTHFNDNPTAACRPFDTRRDGFVIAQGAALLVLEELQHARERGAKIYAEVLGYGLSGDAHHVSAPPENGDGAYRAMKAALRDARVEPNAVEHINCHATSTPLGDRAECRAVQRLFGAHTPNVRLAATKAACGHLMTATGALEAIWTVLSCHDAILPPIPTLEQLDPEIAKLNPLPRFVGHKSEKWLSTKRVAIKNAFGFGGTNAALCISNFVE